MSVLVALLALALLMVVHESGHYFAARAFGMRVTKFSIGFGPTFFKIVPKDGYFWFTMFAEKVRLRMWRHDPEKHGPTIFQVAMIPILAYVQIAGMNPLEENDPKDKGSYANASVIGRIVTIFGGPFANYAFASVLFFLAFFFGGQPIPSTHVNIVPERPAAAAGVKSGDHIVEIAGVPVKEWDRMAEVIASHPGQAIPVVVERNNERITFSITTANEGGKGKIGVSPAGDTIRRPVTAKEAGVLAITTPPAVVKDVLVGMFEWVTGKVQAEVGGPVRIVTETASVAKKGWAELLTLLGLLSAYLGAFNLLPIPALDGGRLIFLGFEATTRKKMNATVEAQIHFVGLVMMVGLIIYITIAKDIPFALK